MSWTKGDTRVIKQVLIVLGIMVSIWLLTSCSPAWHIQQAIKKDPTIIQNDTVTQSDTVWRVVQTVDTVINISTKYDTVKYIQDSVVVKVVKLAGDSIWIEADCPDCPEITNTDTITKTITIHDTFWQALKRTWYVPLILLLVLILIIRYKK